MNGEENRSYLGKQSISSIAHTFSMDLIEAQPNPWPWLSDNTNLFEIDEWMEMLVFKESSDS